jgi:hypothetical protein
MSYHEAAVRRQMVFPVNIIKGILWNEAKYIDLCRWLILQNGGSVHLWINKWFILQW